MATALPDLTTTSPPPLLQRTNRAKYESMLVELNIRPIKDTSADYRSK